MSSTGFGTVFLLLLLVAALPLAAQPAAAPLTAEPWQAAYGGDDATGPHVLGLWAFDAGAETADSSGKGHTLTLKGAVARPDGKFGGALESFPGWPVEDVQHAAVAAPAPDLSPAGAFTLELWLSPKPELEGYRNNSFLVDKKYAGHTDYQLLLSAAQGANLRHLVANLGFGADSATWRSDGVVLEPGTWYHVAFTYDGAGDGRFYLNGSSVGGGVQPGRKGLAPGDKPLSIGDRVGSYHGGFPGLLDQVRLTSGVREFRPARIAQISRRTVFIRGESEAKLALSVTNLERQPLVGATLHIAGVGAPVDLTLPALAPGGEHRLELPFDTRLRPDSYALEATLALPGEPPHRLTERFTVDLVPRPLPNVMPVVMWGVGGTDEVLKELPRLQELGFTHCLGPGCDYGAVWEAGQPVAPARPEQVASARAMMDEILRHGFRVMSGLSPGSWARSKTEVQRVDREGKPYAEHPDVCGLQPKVREFVHNVGLSMAQAYGDHPGWGGAMVHTEVRSESKPCFHDLDRAAFREATGLEIPPEPKTIYGVSYTGLPDFPADRVIPDDYPLYRYYQWFWRGGDGWNDLHTLLHEGLDSAGRPDFWTFHDPAARAAKVYGSGGAVDVISHWTYSYPDPIRIGLCTDELLALAAGSARDQQVMKMTQVIWYRSQTAPTNRPADTPAGQPADWEDRDPGAQYITIAPMHMREAFWAKIARPITGIMYHGWGSLVETDGTSSYRYTHPETRHELRRLTHEIVQPLGPTLMQIPGVRSDVAFLESFASEMFARRGTYGWNGGWAGDAYQILEWAHSDPEVIYDETVMQRGLDGFKVLVATDCDVLTAGVAERIKAFQAAGGIVVGDERLAPAIKPDIVLPVYERTRKAAEDKAALLARAAALREALDARYQRVLDSSNPDVVPYRRAYGEADYLFAVNDRREAGTYVGRVGMVLENGLPAETVLSLNRPVGAVYDLVESRAVETQAQGGTTRIPLALEPGDGRVLMATPRPIAGLRLTVPETAPRGGSVDLVAEVVDAAGAPLPAIVPLRLDITDPDGRPAEFTGWYGARDGRQTISLELAANETPGLWTVRARELASGRRAVAYLRVE